jgi:hypothetical protein
MRPKDFSHTPLDPIPHHCHADLAADGEPEPRGWRLVGENIHDEVARKISPPRSHGAIELAALK